MSEKTKKIIPGIILLTGLFLLFLAFSGLKNGCKQEEQIQEKTFYGSVEIPKELDFAGERVPLERFDVLESLDRELLSNSYFHSQTIRFMKSAPRYFSVIDPILKENGVPADFKYLCLAESNFDERIVSPAGAVGLWQFMKGTAAEYGLEVGKEVDERYHIEKATVAACKYLKESYVKYGKWTLVAASYNAGRSFTSSQIERQKAGDYYDLLLGEETGRYVFRIMALKIIMENPEKYGFMISEEEKYPVIETKIVEVSGPVANFTDFAKQNGISYKMLKMFNPWLREPFLTNATGKTYQVKIAVLK
ncbi:MAG TPA: murein transglycosylase [Prolixibacteraceae bacterium]|nr:murein transglycosylase [Prolixibacteraceae bacterium]